MRTADVRKRANKMYVYYMYVSYFSQIGSLVIEATKKQDSGNYTCSPSNSPSSTVTLHVLNSKYIRVFLKKSWWVNKSNITKESFSCIFIRVHCCFLFYYFALFFSLIQNHIIIQGGVKLITISEEASYVNHI